jgi:hypothetical protein
MLHNIEELESFEIQANDGLIGHARDFFFDDESWVVRYLVVDTGRWLSGRKVLISPISIGRVDAKKKRLLVLLDRDDIKDSPDIDSEMPVSRQHEIRYLNYYGYPHYWIGDGLWGAGSFPSLMVSDIDVRANQVARDEPELTRSGRGSGREVSSGNVHRDQPSVAPCTASESTKREDAHLRSCKSVLHYEIKATDGLIGHVDGFLVDDDTWAIRYLIVQTGHWWSGHKVLIVPDWITGVDWFETTVRVDLSRAAVKEAPHFESAIELDREQEMGLYKHYDRTGYWTNQL